MSKKQAIVEFVLSLFLIPFIPIVIISDWMERK